MKQILVRLGFTSAALAGILSFPIAASAQGVPSYAVGEETIHGTVSGFDGKYDLTVRDERGFVDNVRLHDGTIINPTGLRLAGGMTVTIFGHADGNRFAANEIETPYHRSYAYGYPYGPYPYAPYYGAGYCCGYGYGLGVGIRIR